MASQPDVQEPQLGYEGVASRQLLRKHWHNRIYGITIGFGAGLSLASSFIGFGVPAKLLGLLGPVVMLLGVFFFIVVDRK